MTGPAPVVATIRRAVRAALVDLTPGELVLVACSGGADSLALASATAFVAPRLALRVGAAIVDHGLQAGSAAVAENTRVALVDLGLAPVTVVVVDVGSVGGPEAAARDARYAALRRTAQEQGAAAVLLGHTLDDQAETVLLGLARGSGARSLAGMAPVSDGLWRRPFLDVRRADTAAACVALGLTPWEDPHNSDSAFARVRVRRDVLPVLEDALGPGVAPALARTARLLRSDADALDAAAAAALLELSGDDVEANGIQMAALEALAPAVRARVLRALALGAGAAAADAVHVSSLDALVTAWHGQGPVSLPGGVVAQRAYGRLRFSAERGFDHGLTPPQVQHPQVQQPQESVRGR
jgi:tRNA(Ile)-lysidine synthase